MYNFVQSILDKRVERQQESADPDEVDPQHYIDQVVGQEDITYEIYDGYSYYPVTYSGKITNQGSKEFSGGWTVLGMTTHHWSTRPIPWEQLRRKLDREPLSGYLWDDDHGGTRRWGRKVKMYRLPPDNGMEGWDS